MIKILIITHGNLGHELLNTAQSIVGNQQGVFILSLSGEESLNSLCERAKQTVDDMGIQHGIIIFTDMFGGTPCNACLPFCSSENIEIVSGINLYMLISALMNRDKMNLKEFAVKVVNDGRKNVANIKSVFAENLDNKNKE